MRAIEFPNPKSSEKKEVKPVRIPTASGGTATLLNGVYAPVTGEPSPVRMRLDTALIGPNKARVWAMGPAATYTFTVGQTPVTVLAKWSQEFGAVRTFQGNTATIAAMFKF